MAVGIDIHWQEGPCTPDPVTGVRLPNGAFVEGVIEAARQRLVFFQATQLAHPANQAAIEHLELALEALDERSRERKQRGVEGAMTV